MREDSTRRQSCGVALAIESAGAETGPVPASET